MDPLARSILGMVTWLAPTPSGGVAAFSATGESLGELSPSLDVARRQAIAAAGPVAATWKEESGETVQLLVLAIPGLEGVLGLSTAACEGLVGPAVENLVNQIAHDVRNFAFAISLQAELGERRAATPDVKGHFAAVLRQIDGLKRFIDKLLLFGRPIRLDLDEVALGPLAREAVRRLQFGREAAQAPVSVAVAVDDAVTGLRWDRAAIGKAVDALLDNAVQSADPPPPVVLEAVMDGDLVRLSVSDRGSGISPQSLAELSVPMLVRRPGGAGLGLAIARKIAAAHGGTLSISSSTSGTTVTLLLPREARGG